MYNANKKKNKISIYQLKCILQIQESFSYYLRQEQIIALEYEIILKLLSKMVLRRLQKLGNYSLFLKKNWINNGDGDLQKGSLSESD